MDTKILIALIGILLILVLIGVIAYVFLFGQSESELDVLLRTNRDAGMTDVRAAREALHAETEEESEEKYELLKEAQRKNVTKSGKIILTEEQRFYQAGIFTERERREFGRLRYFGASLGVPAGFIAYFMLGEFTLPLLTAIIVTGAGWQSIPSVVLDSKMKKRSEEIMFYLPLVIEQVAIGVGSSLDTGPALARVVEMADERDSHNAVTELVGHVEVMVRSGLSLQEALIEVGKNSGHSELKHTFMALAQVSKHGGEISKQLNDLGAAITQAREGMIEEKIHQLELKATGPVAMVFFGFIVILLVGFGMNIKRAFE